ncbi:MAG: hypothetical protein K9N47_02740 [Prosthecobacter sp.]|uniref:hypothetical protein n=1 Tax=Prosthecobacter sp. TaxID=1965333 RepID=UPI0025DC4A15|nr:hypothetical protein [Prosthecobacter sp.]MCF7785007.1 hypothetical protein [Prosthecobacter sp.]
MMKNKNLIFVAVLLVVTAIAGRVIAYKSASNYGHTLKMGLSTVSTASFANTSKLRNYFAYPEMTSSYRRLEILSFLGGGYRSCADELQRGMIYLSEQMALAPAERFSAPPSLSRLALSCDDRTDEGIAAAVTGLMDSYESQLK